MLLGNIGSVFPSFVIGPVMVLVFALWLRWLPAGGWDDFSPRFMVMPIALLIFINVATIGRVMRGSLIEVMHSNFIRTARAKGLPTRTVVLRHALKPALLPVVSVLGPLAISSITAALVTETVFSLPGIGKLIVNGAGQPRLHAGAGPGGADHRDRGDAEPAGRPGLRLARPEDPLLK
jgi:oligopeptide transport system permease protein